MNFLDLPDDIHSEIFSYIKWIGDVYRCSLVSQKFKQLFEKHVIEIRKNKKIDIKYISKFSNLKIFGPAILSSYDERLTKCTYSLAVDYLTLVNKLKDRKDNYMIWIQNTIDRCTFRDLFTPQLIKINFFDKIYVKSYIEYVRNLFPKAKIEILITSLGLPARIYSVKHFPIIQNVEIKPVFLTGDNKFEKRLLYQRKFQFEQALLK